MERELNAYSTQILTSQSIGDYGALQSGIAHLAIFLQSNPILNFIADMEEFNIRFVWENCDSGTEQILC